MSAQLGHIGLHVGDTDTVTAAESAAFVDVSGDTMTGALLVPKVRGPSSTTLVLATGNDTTWATLSATGTSTILSLGTVVQDAISLSFGSSFDASIQWGTAQTNDALMIAVQGGSAAQSGNIIITEADNILADHGYGTTADPRLIIASATTPSTDYLELHHDASFGFLQSFGATLVLRTGGSDPIYFQTAANTRWQINAAGDLLPGATNTYDLGSSSTAVANAYVGTVQGATSNTLTLASGDGTAWATLPATNGIVSIGQSTRFADAIGAVFGGSNDVSLVWSTAQTNDALVLGIGVGSAAQSGNVILTNGDYLSSDHGHAAASNPTLIIHSAGNPVTDGTQWLSLAHDGTNAVLSLGSGELEISGGAIEVTGDGIAVLNGNDLAVTSTGRRDGSLYARYGGDALDGAWIALGSENTLVLTNNTNRSRDHDHGTQTSPTLFIHSATDPNTDNTQWLSLTHDASNAIIRPGTGNLNLRTASNALAVQISNTTVQLPALTLHMPDAIPVSFGSSNDAIIAFRTTHTNDALTISVEGGGAAQSGNVIITERGNETTDHGYAASTHPRLYIASNTTPASNWVSIHHDGSVGRILNGSGEMLMQGTTSAAVKCANTYQVRLGNTAHTAQLLIDTGAAGDTLAAFTQIANTSGTPTCMLVTCGAHTSLTNASLVDIDIDLKRTVEFDGGAATIGYYRGMQLQQPTLNGAASGLTVTDPATLYIEGAPVDAGANIGFTNGPYAIFVDAGMSRFDGDGTNVFELPEDNTDPSTGLTVAPLGRIPIKVAGTTVYLAYWT